MQWVHKRFLKNTMGQSSVEKGMTIIFWDLEVILLIEFMFKGNAQLEICKRLYAKKDFTIFLRKHCFCTKTPGCMKCELFKKKCGFEISKHPSYNPDFAPNNYYLFSKLKNLERASLFITGYLGKHG